MSIPFLPPRPPTDTQQPSQDDSSSRPVRRRGLVWRSLRGMRWLLAGPIDWAGARRIRGGASFISGLVAAVRAGQAPDPRLRTAEDGIFDRTATSFMMGISIQEYDRRMALRRRQTARLAYISFGLGFLVLVGLLRLALAVPLTAGRIFPVLEGIPLCALFILYGFYNALLNFQIRTCRRVSWRGYLLSPEPLLPR